MAEYKDREHYIPLRKADIIRLLCQDKQLPPAERDRFRQFARLIGAVFHYEYLQQLDDLKDAYAPFDPDSETQPLQKDTPDEREKKVGVAFDAFVRLMERANFKRLTWADVEAAMAGGASDWGINMYLDKAVFDHIEIFVRGDTMGKRTRRRWTNFFRLEEVKLPVFRRLVFMVKLRPHKALGPNADTKAIYLKVFKDIPKQDLEMLLPGAQLQMPKGQQVQLGGTLVSGLGFLLWKIWTEMWELIHQVATLTFASGGIIWGPIAALLGYGYKQYYGYQVTRQSYSLQLTESLYYQNLDNNAGVMTRLLDEAEEQECREVLLAYYFLWRYAPPQGWNTGQVDDYVELYLEGAAKLKVDFEVDDALAKLERLELVRKTGEMYHAVPIEMAMAALNRIWDGYFRTPAPLAPGGRGVGGEG